MMKNMAAPRAVLVCLLAAAATASAWAQDAAQPDEAEDVPAQAAPVGLSALRPLIGGGFTVGGSKLATVEFSDGSREHVRAGQWIQFHAGAVYQSVPQFSLQATIGFHGDVSGDDDASVQFVRFPLEVLGHFHINEKWRFGGGARFVTGARFAPHGAALLSDESIEYDNTIGVVVEGEYSLSPEFGLKLRYVSEKYETQRPFPDTVNGSHVGVMLNVYF
jgi:hypothetical protein